jgi:hypothetical protein
MSLVAPSSESTLAWPKKACRWAVLAMVLSVSSVLAETVRVTAWNMEMQTGGAASGATNETIDMRIEKSAAALGKTNADVILLRHVRDWQTCAQLVQALRPANYSVLVCSAFHPAQGSEADPGQVAILAKSKAYFCWSEPWRSKAGIPGGFAFAAIQVGKRRVGFFSAQLEDRMSPTLIGARDAGAMPVLSTCVQQWQAEVDSLRNWATNRLEAVVVAGGFDDRFEGAPHEDSAAARILKGMRLADEFLGAPLDHAATQFGPSAWPDDANHYFPARLAPDSQTLPGVVLDRDPATCELDLNPTNVAAAPLVRADTRSEKSTPGSVGAASALPDVLAQSPGNSQGVFPITTPQLLFWLGGALGALAVSWRLVWFFSKQRTALAPANAAAGSLDAEHGRGMASAETVMVMARPTTGSPTDPGAATAPIRAAIHVEASAVTQTQSGHWQQRLRAEDRANAALRTGLIALWGQWLKEKLVRRLMRDRTDMLRAQHEATLKALAVDERLAKIELQLQRQNQAYERRIEELTRELAVAKEGQRELIRAQIDQVKAEMDAARTRALAQSKETEGP